jgi:uncharacterized protein YggE
MKKYLIIPVLLVLSFSLEAQHQKLSETLRTIAVKGKAEKEVSPDIIYFSITLREYSYKEDGKIGIAELEKQLTSAVKKAGIPSEDLVVENVYGYNYNWREENKNFMARKQFELKVSSPDVINNILSKIDPKGIENARISKYTHSKIEEMNEALQIEAIKNAKAKAQALLEPLGEELGRVIEIQENARGYQPVYYYQNNNRMMAMDMASSAESSAPFKNINIEAEIQIVFSIK